MPTNKKSDAPKYKVGDHIQISLNNRILEATIRAVIEETSGVRLKVAFGHEQTALIHEWQVVKENVSELSLPADNVCKPVRYFTADEVRRILAVVPEPCRSMFAIAAMTGLRAGEVMALQKGDLDLGQRVIHVRRSAWQGRAQTVKSKASQAPVAMPEALAALLKDYLVRWQANAEGFLFLNRRGRPFSQNYIVKKNSGRFWMRCRFRGAGFMLSGTATGAS